MPLDVTRIPALEEELRQAKGVKPGGQLPRPDRIAAIEGELKLLRKEGERLGKAALETLGVGTKKTKAEKAKDGELSDPKETADAQPPAENADENLAALAENADASGAPETTAAE